MGLNTLVDQEKKRDGVGVIRELLAVVDTSIREGADLLSRERIRLLINRARDDIRRLYRESGVFDHDFHRFDTALVSIERGLVSPPVVPAKSIKAVVSS